MNRHNKPATVAILPGLYPVPRWRTYLRGLAQILYLEMMVQ